MNVDFNDVIDRLEAICDDRRDGPEFARVIEDLQLLAESGHIEAAEELAEQISLPGLQRDPEAAYKWFYISLSQRGYTVGWEDHNRTPPYYCGQVGDFRNESMVSDLVVEVGWDRVRQLDQEAARWMAERNLTTGCS